MSRRFTSIGVSIRRRVQSIFDAGSGLPTSIGTLTKCQSSEKTARVTSAPELAANGIRRANI